MKIKGVVESRQIKALRALRRSRDNAATRAALKRLQEAAGAGANILPPILEAVEAYATVGEITAAFQETFGEYAPQW